jgi:hypothetical protein
MPRILPPRIGMLPRSSTQETSGLRGGWSSLYPLLVLAIAEPIKSPAPITAAVASRFANAALLASFSLHLSLCIFLSHQTASVVY